MKLESGRREGETRFPKAAIMLSLLITMLLLASCNGPLRTQVSPAECDQLLATSARKVLSTKLNDIEQLVQTIAAIYEIAPDKVAVYEETAQDSIKTHMAAAVQWQSNDYQYGIDIATDQRVFFSIGYQKRASNINDVLLCLGPPDSYLAWYGLGTGDSGNGLLIMLFYPEEGLIISANKWTTFDNISGTSAPIPLDASRLPLIWASFSHSQTTSALINEYVDAGPNFDVTQEPGKSVLAWYMELIKPWPGDVHQLEYSTLAYPEIPLVPDQPNP